MTASGTSPVVPMLAAVSASAGVCPYLLAADGTWRASSTSRDHRCTAVAPSAIVATAKQRRLCLVAEHRTCSTFLAATTVDLGDVSQPRHRILRRPVTRTTPLVLDHPRFDVRVPQLPVRGVGQGGLVALMVVAFGAVAVTRLGGGPDIGRAVIAEASASPAASGNPAAGGSPAPTEAAAPSPTPAQPSRTLVPSDVEPTPTPRGTAAPASPAVGATYTVKSGDTLSGIAARNGTTWKVLAQLNHLKDPTKIRVGQVIRLP
jgi:LysM repeat protein